MFFSTFRRTNILTCRYEQWEFEDLKGIQAHYIHIMQGRYIAKIRLRLHKHISYTFVGLYLTNKILQLMCVTCMMTPLNANTAG